MNITCPVCDTEVEAIMWENGECPTCGNEYCWDEGYNSDTDDVWIDICWKKYISIFKDNL
jgi:Zn finger protein HypA/HybF involved in hydrogenase expression